MKNHKKALLVASFGTAHADSRNKTIAPLEERIRDAFPERRFYRCYTSPTVRRLMARREGIQTDSPVEALERMAADGMEDILIFVTHVIPGIESGNLALQVKNFQDAHSQIRIRLTKPLLWEDRDYDACSEILLEEYGEVLRGKACGEIPDQVKIGEFLNREESGELPGQEENGKLLRREENGELPGQEENGKLLRREESGELPGQEESGKLLRREENGDLPGREENRELPAPEENGEPQKWEEAGTGSALIFFGHGTPHAGDACYERLERAMRRKWNEITATAVTEKRNNGQKKFKPIESGFENLPLISQESEEKDTSSAQNTGNRGEIYVITVEGSRTVTDILPELTADGVKKAYLIPFLLTAGEHVMHDMAGDEPGSVKSILREKKIDAVSVKKGLGEYKQIREYYVRRCVGDGYGEFPG